MRKLSTLLALAFIVMTGCIIYLVKSGVSLRTAPLIRPSVINADLGNVAQGLFLRLFPQFKDAHYVLWGVLPETPESRTLLNLLIDEHERTFQTRPNLILDSENLRGEEISDCKKPCWILRPQSEANELNSNEFIEQRIRPLERPYFNLTWVPFSRGVQVAEECIEKKRLTLNCLIDLSVHESERKMKNAEARYFFLRKYMERDFFLFVQSP